jgi:quercetin dioxygenase-like cupin family protein
MERDSGFVFSPSVENSRNLLGVVIALPITSADTAQRCCMIEIRALPGQEPPPHRHLWENEIFYILDGAATFYCGTSVLAAKRGDYVFMPAGIPHTFRITSPSLQALAVVSSVDQRPVGAETYFVAMSSPATSMVPSNEGITYPTIDPAEQMAVAAKSGTIVLSEEEAKTQMPPYPGFGR